MDLKTYLSLERGRTSALARAIGAHASDVSAWVSEKRNKRPIPVHFGRPIEQATGGQVTRLEMFPEDVIRSVWPELLAKPRRSKKSDGIAASDDAQNPTGGSSSRGIKEARA